MCAGHNLSGTMPIPPPYDSRPRSMRPFFQNGKSSGEGNWRNGEDFFVDQQGRARGGVKGRVRVKVRV